MGWRRWWRFGGERPEQIEREVDDELRFHIEMRVRKLMAGGMTAKRAREEALKRFGDYGRLRSEVLVLDGWREGPATRERWLHSLVRDLAYGLRSLRRNPGFTTVVLLSLGLGIGANTAVFTLLDAVVLRPLPVRDPGELIAIGDPRRVASSSCCSARTDLFSYPLYIELRDAAQTVRGLVATGRTGRLDVRIDEAEGPGTGLEHPAGRMVSGNYFEILGVRAQIGRTFTAEDDRVSNGSPVVVISDKWWHDRFRSDPGIVGRTLIVNGATYTIVGVARNGFTGEVVGQETALWVPLTMQPSINRNEPWLEDRGQSWLVLMGRLASGTTIEQARAEFDALTWRFIDEAAGPVAAVALRDPVQVSDARRGLSWIRSVYSEPLRTLMGAVFLVLLAVCANLANLMYARGAARRREIAVRLALGAGQPRVLRQLLTEAAILAGFGGSLGLVFAWWGSRTLVSLASASPGSVLDAGLDTRVLFFSAGIAVVAALLFGVAPALRLTRLDVAATTRSAGLVAGSRVRGGRQVGPGRALAVVQVALCLMLLVGTSLIVKSTRRLGNQPLGVARDDLLIVQIDFAPAGLDREALFTAQRGLLDRLRAIPGVAAATFSENGIFSGTESGTIVRIDGFVGRSAEDSVVNYDRIGPGYAAAVGGRIVLGRDIEGHDDGSGAPALIVNEAFARRFFAGASAIGRLVRADEGEWSIVGILADVRDHGLRDTPGPRIYIPIEQSLEDPPASLNYEIRTDGDPATLARAVREATAKYHPALRVINARPLTSLIDASMNQDRLVARVISFFGALALGLSVLGLYGVLTWAAVRRTGEFGLRLALGATPVDLRRMVLVDAAKLVALGGAIGLPVALAGAQLLRGQLFGVTPFDPLSFVIAIAVLGSAAAVAGWIPASRAARIGPFVALRTD
jgi:putative ABC transport system permease protein